MVVPEEIIIRVNARLKSYNEQELLQYAFDRMVDEEMDKLARREQFYREYLNEESDREEADEYE